MIGILAAVSNLASLNIVRHVLNTLISLICDLCCLYFIIRTDFVLILLAVS